MTVRDSTTSGPGPIWDTGDPYERALMTLLPPRPQQLLLTACLAEPAVAARAWADFDAAVNNPKTYFEQDQSGLKALLPFVESRLAANGIDAGKEFHTYARVALVREELRNRIYQEILAAVLDAFDTSGIGNVLLKGGALSATVYPQPSRRHNHAIDLLVDARQMSLATSTLLRAEFAPTPVSSGAAFHRNFRHSSGLALGLHNKALYLPQFEMPLQEFRGRLVQAGERPFTMMSAEDSIVHVCGHATYSRSRSNLRWACDVYYLLQRNPTLNWSTVIDTAVRSRLALPVLVLLQWARQCLAAPIPAEQLDELRERARALDSTAAEGIHAALLHSTLSRRRAFGALAGSWRAQASFLGFSAFPSPGYMRWRHNLNQRRWRLALFYADRPRRVFMRLLGNRGPGSVIRPSNNSAGTSAGQGVA